MPTPPKANQEELCNLLTVNFITIVISAIEYSPAELSEFVNYLRRFKHEELDNNNGNPNTFTEFADATLRLCSQYTLL